MPGSDSEDVAHAVSIKVPAFMDTAANGWFAIIEAQFNLKNITNASTKFYHVLSNLPPDLIAQLSPTLLSNKSYEDLKEAVINIYEKTKPELFARLMNDTKMTGRPSFYLRELMTTASKVGVGDDLVKHRFIQALPAAISPVIAAQSDLTLDQLGNLSDQLMPILQKDVCNNVDNRNINNVNQSNSFTQNQSNSSNNSGQNLPIGLRPFGNTQRPKVCRGHLYFAETSRTCKPWCKWPNKRNCHMQPNSRSASPAPPQNRNSTSSNDQNSGN